MNLNPAISVSYTHLDVYKRQVLYVISFKNKKKVTGLCVVIHLPAFTFRWNKVTFMTIEKESLYS